MATAGVATNTAADKKRTPSDFLRQVLGRTVIVRLNSGEDYRGTLACLDPRMNIALENTEELGQNGKPARFYGDACIRGNNVLYISAPVVSKRYQTELPTDDAKKAKLKGS